MTEFTAFIQRLNQTKSLSLKARDALFEGIRRNKFEASETFVSPGNHPNALYFIQSGIVRGAIESSQDKMTTWFKQEGELVIPQGIYSQNVSEEYVNTIIKTTMLSLSYSHLNKVIGSHPEIADLLLLLLEEKSMEGQYRERFLRMPTAKERYDYFLEHEGHILKRVPHFLIASYLNVSKETFSRLNKGLPY